MRTALAPAATAIDHTLITTTIGSEVSGVQLAGRGRRVAVALRALLLERKVLVLRGQHLPPRSSPRPAATSASSPPPTRCCRRSAPSTARCSRSTRPAPPRPGLPRRVRAGHLAHRRLLHARPAARFAPLRRGDPAGRRRHRLRRPAGRLPRRSASRSGAWSTGSAPSTTGGASSPASCASAPARGTAGRSPRSSPSCTPSCASTPRPGPGLFVNPTFTTKIVGLSRLESAALLDLLHRHATAPEHVVRHRWQAGDVVIWDNRSTMHLGVRDYGAAHRVLDRVTIRGDHPVAPGLTVSCTPTKRAPTAPIPRRTHRRSPGPASTTRPGGRRRRRR